MKINIITLHRGENYGSVLQTFALQEELKEQGCSVRVLDYIPYRCTNRGLLHKLKNKSPKFKNPLLLLAARILIYPSYMRKNRVFADYLKRNIDLSDVKFSLSDEAKGLFDDADIFCTGSDQVWNSHWNDGIDKALFLDFAPKGKMCFSYAASIGLSSLPENEKEETKRLLEKYEFLSMREDSGVAILKELGLDSVQVLDPTLLFDKEWWNKYASNKYQGEKYVLTYNLHHDPEIDRYAQTIAKKYGLKVFNVSYNWHDVVRKGQLKWCPPVEDFLGLIRDARFVIADSFHAVAFSSIFEKQFVSICPEIASSRITSLLSLLGLEERLEYGFKDTTILEKEIDFKKVGERLEKERAKSHAYLNNVLSCTSFNHNK